MTSEIEERKRVKNSQMQSNREHNEIQFLSRLQASQLYFNNIIIDQTFESLVVLPSQDEQTQALFDFAIKEIKSQ